VLSVGYRHILLICANGALKFAISSSMYYYCFMISDFPAISDTPFVTVYSPSKFLEAVTLVTWITKVFSSTPY
jgi:hypothetical protein